MSIPFFIASKYVKSRKSSKFLSFIAGISILGIALGIAAVNIALTILDGFENTITEKTIEFNSHITITGYGNKNLPDYIQVKEKIENQLGNLSKSVAPFISKDAIIRSSHLSEGIKLNGVFPTFDNSRIKRNIIAGKYTFAANDSFGGIVLGKKLADKLFVKSGDKITLFTLRNNKAPSIENPPNIEQFIVTGVYESGMAEYDDLNAYIDFYTAQALFNMNDECSGYNIKLKDISKISEAKKELKELLRFPYYVRDYYEINKPIFTWLELQKKPIPIILGLIILVAVFNIVGTLLMMVLEKTNAIGILKTLGANRKQILTIFIYQGLYIGILGILLGNIIALTLSWVQLEYKVISLPSNIYFISSVPIAINFNYYLLISVTALFLSLLASIIPSYIAAKIKPIAAIRFD
ncbi:lipoprotein-releasing system transmembrane protein LolE [bacterium BMS3Abin04]|nr:lipoprotein-releasing system transmembrane protein LolE [bacterium BMS3Abin04]